MQETRHFVRISICLKKSRISIRHCTCTTHCYHGVIHFTFTFLLIITTTTVNISNVCFWFKLKRLQRIRSSQQSCFIINDVLRNFTKFTGSTCLYQSLVTWEKVFSCDFCKISKNIFFTEHFWMTAS